MKRTEININKEDLINIGHDIYCDKERIELGKEEGVTVERVYYISFIIWNNSNEKITLSSIEENYKFELVFQSDNVIERHKMKEISIKITPLSCCVVETIFLMAQTKRKGAFSLNMILSYTANSSLCVDPSKILSKHKVGETDMYNYCEGTFFGRKCMAKILKDQTNDELLLKVKKEVEKTSKLKNAGIEEIIGYVIVPQSRCILFEYSGIPLLHYIKNEQKGYFSNETMLSICSEIAKSIQWWKNRIVFQQIVLK